MKIKRSSIVKVVSVFYLLLFLGLVFYDCPLKPDIAEFIKVPPSTVPEGENGYFAQLGFTAPAGTDIQSFGVTKYRKIMDEAAKRRAEKNAKGEYPKDIPGQIFYKGKELPKEKLYRFVTYSSVRLEKLAADNAKLLTRYSRLKQFRHFEEPGGNSHYQDVPIPTFSHLRNTHSLTLMLALRTAQQQGRPDEALTVVADDMNYWRTVLKQSHILIGKLIAIACLQKDYQVISELIANHELSEAQRGTVLALLTPSWKADDAAFAEAARYEALYVTESLFSSFPKSRLLDRLFIKKNATINRIVSHQIENSRVSKLPPEDFYRFLASWNNDRKELSRLQPDFLYNPLGAILNSIAVPQISSYFVRFHDLEAKRRMVLIHLMAREKNIAPEGMASFIKQLGKEYANPYTGQPMQWNVAKKAIVMDSIPAVAGGEQRRVELVL